MKWIALLQLIFIREARTHVRSHARTLARRHVRIVACMLARMLHALTFVLCSSMVFSSPTFLFTLFFCSRGVIFTIVYSNVSATCYVVLIPSASYSPIVSSTSCAFIASASFTAPRLASVVCFSSVLSFLLHHKFSFKVFVFLDLP